MVTYYHEMSMKILRTCFYAFDLLMVMIVLATILYAVSVDSCWRILFLDIPLFLRFCANILLYRRVWWSIVPIAVFTLLFGIVYTSGFFNLSIFQTANLLATLLGWRSSGIYADFEKYVGMESVLSLIFIWVWLAPIAIYGIQFIREKIYRQWLSLV